MIFALGVPGQPVSRYLDDFGMSDERMISEQLSDQEVAVPIEDQSGSISSQPAGAMISIDGNSVIVPASR